jgi:6-phosphogluconolactonase (cycloisomerase 2 family)
VKRFGKILSWCLVELLALGSFRLFAQNAYVYTNDDIVGTNTVSGFSVAPSGTLTLIPGSPFVTGGEGTGGGLYSAPRIAASPMGGFLYVANGGTNNVSVFSIDSTSGKLTSIPGSPFATGSLGSGTLALAVTPDNKFLYAGDSNADEITVFSIGRDGALSVVAGSPYLIPGVLADYASIDGMSVSPDGNLLAVTLPSEGLLDEIAIFTIGVDGSLTVAPGSPLFPAGGAAGAEFSCSASTLFLYDAINDATQVEVDNVTPNGVLSPVSGSPFNFQNQGLNSNMGILSPGGLTLYESNQYSGQITGLSINSNGGLAPIVGSPFATGLGSCPHAETCPMSMAINQPGTLLLLASYSPEVAVLNIADDGTLTPVAGSPFSSGLSISNAISLAIWPPPLCLPLVKLNQTSLSFGNQLLATTSNIQSATLTNSSPNTALSITSITASSDFALSTAATSCPYIGGTVPSRATCTIDVTFTPTATGAGAGTVTITDNGQASPQTLSLAGTGVAPVAQLETTTLSFPDQIVNMTSAARTVVLDNIGNAPLAISNIGVSGDYAETNDCGTIVAAGGSCTVSVTFTPAAPGVRNGTLTITDNGNGVTGSTQTVSLTGTGAGPMMNLSVSSLSFAALMVGATSSVQNVTLTNTGNVALTISGLAVNGDFSQTNNCGTSVAAGAKCTINAAFNPAAGGTRTGNITFTGNSPNSPQTVTLSGVGQDFSLAAPSGTSTSATVMPGQAATYTLSVGGLGGLSQPVTFTCTSAPAGVPCTFSANPVTPTGSTTSVTVTASTVAPSVSVPRSRPFSPTPPLPPKVKVQMVLGLVLAAITGAIGRRNHQGKSRWKFAVGLLTAGLLLTLALAGCGGGGVTTTHNPGTSAGSYTLTVTGSTGSGTTALSHTMTFTLNVG